jgi:O-antigen/teichoic acid export membrane protein
MGYDYLRMKERSVKYIVYSASRLALSLSLNIYLVVVVKLGVLGVLLSTLFSSITITCVLVVPMLVQIKVRFSLSKCKEMLKYGAPLIPTNVAAFIVHASDRFFVNRFAGLAETGIYSLAYKFGNLPNNFIAAPFMQIWEVRFFQSYRDKNAHILFGTLFTYLCFLLFFAGLGISVCIKDVLMIIADPSYWTAYQVVPIVIICYIVFSFQYVFNMSIYFEKKTHYLAYINGSNAVLNIILNFILIGYLRLGMWGAAFATLICFVYKAIATYTVGNKLYKIHLETARIIKMVCAAFCIYGVCTLVSVDFLLVRLVLKTLLVLTFPLLLYLFRFYTPEELAAIKAFLRSPQLAVAALVRR